MKRRLRIGGERIAGYSENPVAVAAGVSSQFVVWCHVSLDLSGQLSD
jgi:hypothetical protein